jgi:carnitine 3-dehydrogenase
MPTAAIIGGGVIGSAWASRFLLNGWHVQFHDPAPNSEAVLNIVLDKARRWVPEVYDRLPEEGALTLCGGIADAVSGADWVQESTPERLEIKQAVLAEIQAQLCGRGDCCLIDLGLYALGIAGR